MNALAKKSLAGLAAAVALALSAPAFADSGRHRGWDHQNRHYKHQDRHHHGRHYEHQQRHVYVQEYRPVYVEPVYYEAPRPQPYAVINVPPIILRF